jgi:FkbM family methyltransferase
MDMKELDYSMQERCLRGFVRLLRRVRIVRALACRLRIVTSIADLRAEPDNYCSGRKWRIIDHYDLGVVATWYRPDSSDEIVFKQVFCANELYSFIKRLHAPVDDVKLVVDGGANIGLTAFYLSVLFPNAKVIGYEPDESNIRQARRNLWLNDARNVELRHAALWGRSQALTVQRPDGQFADYSVKVDEVSPAGQVGDCVPGVTLADILDSEGAEYIDVLKLDVEGAEQQLFSTEAVPWMDRVHYLSVEPHEGASTFEGLMAVLVQNGFHAMRVGELVFAARRRDERVTRTDV